MLGQVGLSDRDPARNGVSCQGQGHVSLTVFIFSTPKLLIFAETIIDQI
jgi:hypothetical protein